MPWQLVQLWRITFQTSPSGLVTWGRVALLPWAARGSAASSRAIKALLIRAACILFRLLYTQTASDAVHLIPGLNLTHFRDLGRRRGLGVDVGFGAGKSAQGAFRCRV